MIKYRFSRQVNQDFAKTLRLRVNAYFKEHDLDRSANSFMVFKSVLGLGVFFTLYAILMFGGISNPWILLSLFVGLGFGMAFIGVSVMHDALHGSYSRSKKINSLVGISAAVIGVGGAIWKIHHNVLHHTYTNIEHADEDSSYRYVLRFSPHQPRLWFHRFQHIYCVFFYCIATVFWVTVKDFGKLQNYKKEGLVKPGAEYRKILWTLIAEKAAYHAYLTVIPIIFLPQSAGLTVLMWFVMHFVAGFTLSMIFQTSHINTPCEFLDQQGKIDVEENWYAHQLFTTVNYGAKSKLVTFISGGLNHQIEHHLFPNICHVHYPKISHIVKETAEEFNLPYHDIPTMGKAITEHFKMLRLLGKPVKVKPPLRHRVAA